MLLIGPAALARGTVTISGVVYTFNTPYPVAGATVSFAETPQLSTTTDANGRYGLTVPDEAEVTPVAMMPGYKTMYLQTFETEGEDLEDVWFQFVPQPTYDFLAAMLGIPADSRACNIVTTVSVAGIQGLTFEEFAAFGPHGRGATVAARPALPGPLCFNASVLPDPTLTETSQDGGVLFVNVAPGTYHLTAHHPRYRFRRMTAKCEPGRFINASPPKGLAEKSSRD